MKKSKQRKLEEAGWIVGSTTEFLNLRNDEIEYLEMKISLARRLKSTRTEKNMTQVQLAKLISSSQSRVAKMEGGDPSVSIDLIIQSLIALGATNRDIAQALVTV